MKTHNTIKTRELPTLLAMFALLWGSLIPPLSAQGQDRTTVAVQSKRLGQVVKSYVESQSQQDNQGGKQKPTRPLWVEAALTRSLQHFKQRQRTPGLPDAETELRLLRAEQDDLGMTHVRMQQLHQGIEVFGGEVIAHLDAESVSHVSGRAFDGAQIETTPTIDEAQAIENAKAALGYNGEFTDQPTAKLLILPHRLFKEEKDAGATLVYQVELKIEDGTNATAHHQYFVNAKDGSVVWHYDSLPHHESVGQSLYSGQVVVNDTFTADPSNPKVTRWTLNNPLANFSSVRDMNGQTTGGGNIFLKTGDVWGNGTTGNAQSAAVDVHYAVEKAWAYFLERFGRNGADGKGTAITSFVHYGTNYNNAHGANNQLKFGDGDGTRFSSLVSLDVVAHEFTHNVTQYSADLVYAGESGALNESFSDIFGTAVEHYVGNNPNYLMGEACFTPGTAGDALRSLADPRTQGDPDYYPNRNYQGTCKPDGNNDNCGVHSNSGIMNKAFYLLSEGGIHPVSKVFVAKIGRDAAERIFYRALTFYLTKSARFYDARVATLRAATEFYGVASTQYRSVVAAWNAVGVRSQQNFDFDADGRTDAAIWRPSDGTWYVFKSSNGGTTTKQWGISGDIIVPGDYDGDGDTDYAVWRPSDGTWYLNLGYKYNLIIGAEVPNIVTRQWGAFLDQPVPGDYDGDGKTDFAVWRPSDGTWHIINSSNGSYQPTQWGVNGDIPVPGDYDGDGKTDRAVYRPSNGYWYIINSSDNSAQAFQWGISSDVPVPGDYDGDGKTDRAVYRRSTGVWHIINSADGSYRAVQWGLYYDDPVPGDYDGDGKTDLAVWRPSEGTWHIVHSRPGSPDYLFVQYGIYGDIPVPKANKYKSPLTGGKDYNFPNGN